MDMKKFNLQTFIISIVIIGVVLVVGIYITDQIGEVSMAQNTVGSVTNETVSLDTLTGIGTIANSGAYQLSDWNASLILNASIGPAGATTNETLFEGTDYTLTTTDGTFVNVTGDWNRTFVTYTYTYTATTDASDAADDVVDALATGTSWISILVVVGFAVIILTMLTSGLGSAARREDTPYY